MIIEKSLKAQERAGKLIPGMTQLLSKRPDQFSRGIWPGYYSKAKGAEVWDLDGNCYLDMSISGIGANVLGYADHDVDEAVTHAINKGSSSSLNCLEEVELGELLCEIHPWADMVRFARTGGESMAIAVRIARADKGRERVAFCGYHGWHDWYLSANLGGADVLGEHLLEGLSPEGVPRGLQGTAFPFHYNRLDELAEIVKAHGRDLAAIVMEPIRSEQPAEGFLEGVRCLAEETGAVLIVDEVSSAFRMNSAGAHMALGLDPDMAVFSKALGNGYAIGAVIGKESVMQSAQNTFISSTNWTERIGPTAALATVNKHREKQVWKHLSAIGEAVQKGWKDSAAKHCLDIHVGGIPALSHFSFKYQNSAAVKALFVQLMLEKHFLASNLFYAMYAHTNSHVESYLLAVDECFCEIAESLATERVEEKLGGEPASSGFARLA